MELKATTVQQIRFLCFFFRCDKKVKWVTIFFRTLVMTRDTKISGLKKRHVTDSPSSSSLDHRKQVRHCLHLHYHFSLWSFYLSLYFNMSCLHSKARQHCIHSWASTQQSPAPFPAPPPSRRSSSSVEQTMTMELTGKDRTTTYCTLPSENPFNT